MRVANMNLTQRPCKMILKDTLIVILSTYAPKLNRLETTHETAANNRTALFVDSTVTRPCEGAGGQLNLGWLQRPAVPAVCVTIAATPQSTSSAQFLLAVLFSVTADAYVRSRAG